MSHFLRSDQPRALVTGEHPLHIAHMLTPMRLIFPLTIAMIMATPLFAQPCAILLHGLSRGPASMSKMEEYLGKRGFQVINHHYPSRSATIPALSEAAIGKALADCRENTELYFVTHSLGGILVRDYYFRHPQYPRPKAVVMLGPPNRGSEIIDTEFYKEIGGLWNGPAGDQLSARANSYVNQLGAVDFPVGVIAGNQSINPVYSNILPGDDDGKVSVRSTWVEGMADWIVMPVSHTFMMQNDSVIQQAEYFLMNREFDK